MGLTAEYHDEEISEVNKLIESYRDDIKKTKRRIQQLVDKRKSHVSCKWLIANEVTIDNVYFHQVVAPGASTMKKFRRVLINTMEHLPADRKKRFAEWNGVIYPLRSFMYDTKPYSPARVKELKKLEDANNGKR